jgi:putative peptidoglycan lipid II flippase
VSLFKSASTVSVLTLVSRVSGLIRELLVATIFGATAMTDAFQVAFRIPNLFRRLFAEGAFSQAFVPVLAHTKEKEGEIVTKGMIDKIGSLLVVILLILCVAGVLAANWLVFFMASGLDKNPESYDAAIWMTRLMFPYIGCMSLVAFSAGILNTWKRFALSAVTPVLLNISMIGCSWLLVPILKKYGIEPILALAVGVVVGGLLQLGLQIPTLLRMKLLPRISFRWSVLREAWMDPHTQRMCKLILPALLGVSVAQFSLVINTQIASHLMAGSVSWLTYADRLMEFPTALLGVALGVVLIPQLSAARARKDQILFSNLLDIGLRQMIVLALPCSLALIFFAKPIICVLYNYGAFDSFDVHQTSLALMGWGAGLVGLISIKVLGPGYYASMNIKTPVKIAIAVLILTQCMNVIFVPYLQHAGLALSISLGSMINAVWLLVGLIKRKLFIPSKGWLKFLAKLSVAGAIMALFLIWAAKWFDWVALHAHWIERLGLFALISCSSAIIYFMILMMMGVKVRALFRG